MLVREGPGGSGKEDWSKMKGSVEKERLSGSLGKVPC